MDIGRLAQNPERWQEMIPSKIKSFDLKRAKEAGRWGIAFFLVAGLAQTLSYAQGPAADLQPVSLTPPYAIERFGISLFFPSQGNDGARIITPGRKHLEIDISVQRLRAYDEMGLKVLDAPVSTGKPGLDEKGWCKSETVSGIHRVVEVKPFKRWSKDPRVKMLNWIGIAPGVEKGIHSLNPVDEFADYEKRLGQKASHGCVRVSRENGRRLTKWIGDEWKTGPLIVYIYDRPIRKETVPENRYALFLILQEGAYSYDPLSQEELPIVERSEGATGRPMKPGSFLLYKKETEVWRLIQPRLPQ